MNKKIIIILLGVFIFISLALHLIGINKVPPCLNADEAAYGYNAYSVLKTGRDEYGALLPLRFKSFEDYKLPIYSYLSIPFIGIFGLNDHSTRALNVVIGVLFVPLIFFVIKELFKNEKIALIGAFLASVSTWIHIMSRQAQEGVICAFFILLALLFLIKLVKTNKLIFFFLTNISILLSTFSYHFGRIFLAFFVIYQAFYFFQNRKKTSKKNIIFAVITLLAIIAIPLAVDYHYSVNRVANLVFYKNPGITLRLQEYLVEHNFTPLHNLLTESIRDITNRYMEQLSPEFFLTWGDKSMRFGYYNLGVITLIEYFFIFIGLFYLFKNKAQFRYLIILLFFLAPIGNALTWQEYSLIRTYFMIFPLLTIVSYGIYSFFSEIKNKKLFYILLLIVFGYYGFNLVNNWDIYLFHYPKRIEIIRAWQCGYKEMSDYLKENYDKYDRFAITDKYGQPYIFVLFYTKYDPAKYQQQAKISAPDKFGFGQIDKFDKYSFKFSFDPKARKTVYIGYPEDFKGIKLDQSKLKKIQIRSEEIFWIYETN
jgi:4-amino-4-deoxy-L-arabinose transferase-like glycosyltransferase